ncbi:hypothetical protein Clacol_007683 [Clathrus columnatus]|uniref:Ras GEF n=1 Tax=Clathrus columnatus TaxID=1419009 RepID=A0AAV5AJY9_9AGAM|nr:hypothetical protein Clacol_007683 [Clathrus columnatus]
MNPGSTSINRGRGMRYRPPSINSIASNFSSLSTDVHPSSIYEGHEGPDRDSVSFGDNIDGSDDADTYIPDAYDEDKFDDYYGDGSDPNDTRFLYHDTSTIENALPFYVLAVYDFLEGDPESMLLFQKGDILEIISVQPSGWWAAQALDDRSENVSGAGRQSQPQEERVGWIPSAFVNVVPTHLIQRLKNTPPQFRVAEYEKAELFVESPEDIDSLIQTWGLDFDAPPVEDEEDYDEHERGVQEIVEETLQMRVQHPHASSQTPTHAPIGPRIRPLPSITAAMSGGSGTPPQLNTSLPVVATPPSLTTTTGPNASKIISPIQPSPVTPVPPNVPAPAPFNLSRRSSLGKSERDLPPSLPPPDTPLPPLPEVAEYENENTEEHRFKSLKRPDFHQHQRTASASTVGSTSTIGSTSAAAGTLIPNQVHNARVPSPLPTPPTSAKSYGRAIGIAPDGMHSTSTLSSNGTVASSNSGATMTTNKTSPPPPATPTTLGFVNKDKPTPPTPPNATTDIPSRKDLRGRSNSTTHSSRSITPPNSAQSAPGSNGQHPPILTPGVNTGGASTQGHAHSASLSTPTHSRSTSSLSSLNFLPRSRSVNHGQGSGGVHNVISSTITNSLSSLRRRAARHGHAGSGSGSGGASGAGGTTPTETINITSSPKPIHQRLLSDETVSDGSAGSSLTRIDDFDLEDDYNDDDELSSSNRKQQRGRTSPSAVQAGGKEKLRKLLGEDAVPFLNSGVGGTNSSSSLSSPSIGKANAGAFARRRREINRRSQESDSSVGANGRPGSASSLPSSTSLNSASAPNINSTSGDLVSHLELTSPVEDHDIELDTDTEVELDPDIDARVQRSFSPTREGLRPGSGSLASPLTTLNPRTPRTPRTAGAFPPGATGVTAGGKNDKVRRLLGDDDAQAFHNAKQALATLPWYLKPEHDPDSGEIRLEHDGSIRYGSVEALVERLTVPFLKSDLEKRFRHVFLLTFHSFTTAERILELLIEKYEMDSPPGLDVEEFNEWKDKKLRPTQARVLHVLTVWVDNYGLIQDDPRVIPRLQDFLELIHSPPQHAQNARLILQNIATKRWTDINLPALESVAATRRPAKSSKTKTDILRIDPGELARHLTLYEARLYLKIRPHECFKFAASQKSEGIANLRAFIATSDKIASWVKLSVLKNDPLGKRADVIHLWIRVAERCRALNNFSSTAAIIAALTSQVIARLQLTWAHVSRTSRIDPLMKIFETTNNFASYRNILMMVDGPCVPYIGTFLSDMVKISEGIPDPPKLVVPIADSESGASNAPNITTPNASGSTSAPNSTTSSSTANQQTREIKLISFSKYTKMEDAAQMILKFQPKVRDAYKLVELVSTMQFVESQLNLAATTNEDEFWTRSQELQRSELAHVDIKIGLEQAGF